MSTRQTGFTIMEGYTLPSKGKIYSENVNPLIELRSMTAREEMRRLSPSSTPLKTLADIIEDCCIEKPAIHVYDMSLGVERISGRECGDHSAGCSGQQYHVYRLDLAPGPGTGCRKRTVYPVLQKCAGEVLHRRSPGNHNACRTVLKQKRSRQMAASFYFISSQTRSV